MGLLKFLIASLGKKRGKATDEKIGIISVLIAIALHLLAFNFISCQSNDYISEEELIGKGLGDLYESWLLLDEMNPISWVESDIYFSGDYREIEGLEEKLREARRIYDEVTEYCQYYAPAAIEDEGLLIEVSEELDNLRVYVLLGAQYLKTALDLIEKDLKEGNNSSKNIVEEIGAYYINEYQFAFEDEFERVCRKYEIVVEDY